MFLFIGPTLLEQAKKTYLTDVASRNALLDGLFIGLRFLLLVHRLLDFAISLRLQQRSSQQTALENMETAVKVLEHVVQS